MTRARSTIDSPRPDWLAQLREEIIEPDLPIIDPHHHLWTRHDGYLLDDILADAGDGHDVVATVFVQCRYAHRTDGPVPLQPVGETEAVRAIAEAGEARPGAPRIAAGIVGFADLTLGDAVDEVLEAHIAAAGGRFRGIRHITANEPSFESALLPVDPGIMASAPFREGFARLAAQGLSYDSWLYHPQIPQLTDLARAFPDTVIVLDHVGGPLGIGRFTGLEREVFDGWKRALTDLAACPNVSVKLGGLGMDITGVTWARNPQPPGSQEMADRFRPYVETAIELFGPGRCMFESNFPVDKVSSSYHVLFNAFKRLASGAGDDEKRLLFHDTAARVYRLSL